MIHRHAAHTVREIRRAVGVAPERRKRGHCGYTVLYRQDTSQVGLDDGSRRDEEDERECGDFGVNMRGDRRRCWRGDPFSRSCIAPFRYRGTAEQERCRGWSSRGQEAAWEKAKRLSVCSTLLFGIDREQQCVWREQRSCVASRKLAQTRRCVGRIQRSRAVTWRGRTCLGSSTNRCRTPSGQWR